MVKWGLFDFYFMKETRRIFTGLFVDFEIRFLGKVKTQPRTADSKGERKLNKVERISRRC